MCIVQNEFFECCCKSCIKWTVRTCFFFTCSHGVSSLYQPITLHCTANWQTLYFLIENLLYIWTFKQLFLSLKKQCFIYDTWRIVLYSSDRFLSFLMPDTPFTCYEGDVISVDGTYASLCNGSNIGIGRIAVCVNGSYIAVCRSGFSSQEAQAYCQNYYGASSSEQSK